MLDVQLRSVGADPAHLFGLVVAKVVLHSRHAFIPSAPPGVVPAESRGLPGWPSREGLPVLALAIAVEDEPRS